MESKSYLTTVARHWRSALIVALAFIVLGILGSILISPRYQAQTTLRMVTPRGGSSGGTSYEINFANRLTNTYTQIATSQQVMSELKQRLGVNELPDIQVSLIPDSEIMQIKVESSSPARAAKTANALADILVGYGGNSTASANADEMTLLEGRMEAIKTELAGYQQQYQDLGKSYSQTSADLNILDRRIKMMEASYQSLLSQYELTVVDVALLTSGTTTPQRKALGDEIDRLGKELDTLHAQFKDLSVQSTAYQQQMTLAQMSMQSTQSTYATILGQYASAQLANLRQENAADIVVVSPAFEPSAPAGPGRLFVLGLGLLLGLIFGILATFAADHMDPRIYTSGQVTSLNTGPVLGSIANVRAEQGNMPAVDGDPILQRDYLLLRARLQRLMQENSAKAILFASPHAGEGKSTLVYNLACGLGQDHLKVLVIDANLRSPVQHELFNVKGEYGIADFLRGEHENLNRIILRGARPSVDLLPSLAGSEDPGALLQPERWRALIQSVGEYDAILIDSPALLEYPDALALSKAADGVIAVARWGQTTTDDLQQTASELVTLGSKVLGTVITGAQAGNDLEAIRAGIAQSVQHLNRRVPARQL